MPTTRPKPRKSATERRALTVDFISPQLATLTEDAPTGALWVNESKYDGYRMQAHSVNIETILYSRSGLDWSHKFSDIQNAITELFSGRQVVLDGEIVVGPRGTSSFHALQNALSNDDTSNARYMVFDVLFFDGLDLRPLPLAERRAALETLFRDIPARGQVQLSRILRGTAATVLAKACAVGAEGIVCKRRDATYTSGRAGSWVKVKCGKRQEFVVVGYSEPKGSRSGIGALLLGVYEQGKVLRYAGRVGSGFSTRDLTALREELDALTTKQTPLHESVDLATVKEAGKVTWVKPTLVAEVSFTEWTAEGLLRHPVFQGLREDKKATNVKREDK
ncbi:MAG: non-homologous end-joining DNA ligase [Gemmatimonadaceae bacterium]